MVTLTYRPDVVWMPHQISDLLKSLRKYLTYRSIEFRYVWVQEFTKKGKPHYHVLIWLPLGITLPKPDKRGWWPNGMTKIEWARNAIGYIAKYASKGDSLCLPAKGARMHGNGGLRDEALKEARWWKMPGWMREQVTILEQCRRRKGGGWFSLDSGEIFTSPWQVIFKGGRIFLELKPIG